MTLRVLFIAPHPVEGPSTRFRISQFLPYLRENGVECDLRPFLTTQEARTVYHRQSGSAGKIAVTLRAAFRRLADVVRASRYDIVYILREGFPFGPPVIENALRKRAGRMIFDFDDAIHLPSTAFDNPLDRLRDFAKPGKLIRAADMVVPGSEWLASRARDMGAGSGRIAVLPTVVDARLFCPAPRPQRQELVIGWIGTPRNTAYLTPLAGVMRRLCAAYPFVRFRFVGAEPFDCDGASVQFRKWALDDEVADVQDFDIGIMPLPDDDFTRGKCGFKLIEYMACGLPTVASPVGANLDIVADGQTGFLAADDSQWEAKLSLLICDPALRTRMGAAGRARVEGEYSLQVVAPRLLDTLRRVAAAR